ncbi:hypothetical protein HMPREF1013_00210 [Bacillus sp. 2_A_57_CT2]|nr:hypothetical protein HMPREF1013_00210 [Bacillus sp. 2_A_57_CT2]
MKGNAHFFLVMSIAVGFFILSWISTEIKLSNYFIFGCSIFVVFFSMGDLLHQSISEFTEGISRKWNYFGIAFFYTLSIPIALILGFLLWIGKPDGEELSKMSDSLTFISIGLLFISFAFKTISISKN